MLRTIQRRHRKFSTRNFNRRPLSLTQRAERKPAVIASSRQPMFLLSSARRNQRVSTPSLSFSPRGNNRLRCHGAYQTDNARHSVARWPDWSTILPFQIPRVKRTATDVDHPPLPGRQRAREQGPSSLGTWCSTATCPSSSPATTAATTSRTSRSPTTATQSRWSTSRQAYSGGPCCRQYRTTTTPSGANEHE